MKPTVRRTSSFTLCAITIFHTLSGGHRSTFFFLFLTIYFNLPPFGGIEGGSSGAAQSLTITLDGSGAISMGCCNRCSNDFWCINSPDSCGTASSTENLSFFDSVPAGSVVTSISVTYFGNNCGATTVTTYINTIPIMISPDTSNCACGACDTLVSPAYTDTNGIPSSGYVYGGWNSFIITADSAFCYSRILINLVYDTISFEAGPVDGPTDACSDDTVQYSITANPPAAQYSWTVPAGWNIISGQGTDTIAVVADSADGIITLVAVSSWGDTAISTLQVMGSVPPPTPGPVTGPASPCVWDTATYSIAPVPGADDYFWSYPGPWVLLSTEDTTDPVFLAGTAGGNVCALAANSCGMSAQSCINVNVSASPATPGNISGQTSLCGGQSSTYSINPVTGATYYTWSVPAGSNINTGQGTATIDNTFGTSGGVVCVTAGNNCGMSAMKCLSVIILNPPPNSGYIVGPANVCAGLQATYSVVSGSDGSTFTWSVPAGAWIDYGQGNDTMGITFGTMSGTISVVASNGCGSAPAVLLSVNVISITTTISQTNILCNGDCNGTASVTPSGGISPYTWSWNPTGQTGSTATGLCASTHTCTVWDNNFCSATATFTITQPGSLVITPPADDTICLGYFTILTASASGGAPAYTFTWAPDSGLSATMGSTVIATPSETTVYTILVADGNDCYSTGNVTVFVDSCIGINLREAAYPWKIFPNPLTGKLVVESRYPVTEDVIISIHAINGQALFERKYTANGLSNRINIDLTEFSRGIYLLRVISPSITGYFKLIKND